MREILLMWHVCIQRSTCGGVPEKMPPRRGPEAGGKRKGKVPGMTPQMRSRFRLDQVSGLTKRALNLSCLKLLVHGRGAVRQTGHVKMCGWDSGFKHAKISHLYSQISTKLENINLHISYIQKKNEDNGCETTSSYAFRERHYRRL